LVLGHDGPESLQADSGSVVHCNEGIPQFVKLIGPSVADVDQVLIDLLDDLNGLKYTTDTICEYAVD
jgi:hypothetical protein